MIPIMETVTLPSQQGAEPEVEYLVRKEYVREKVSLTGKYETYSLHLLSRDGGHIGQQMKW